MGGSGAGRVEARPAVREAGDFLIRGNAAPQRTPHSKTDPLQLALFYLKYGTTPWRLSSLISSQRVASQPRLWFPRDFRHQDSSSLSTTAAEAEVISSLAEHGFYIDATSRTELPSIRSRPTALFTLEQDGTWQPVASGELPHDGALVKIFGPSKFRGTGGDAPVFRYEASPRPGGPGALFSFKRIDGKSTGAATPEAYLAQRLGRSVHHVHTRYSKIFQELKKTGWSDVELKRLVGLLTSSAADAAWIHLSLRAVVDYQQAAKSRGWPTKGFLLSFAENKRGLPLDFTRLFTRAWETLQEQELLPELSQALLLELAKYDPSLKSWEALPELFYVLFPAKTSEAGGSVASPAAAGASRVTLSQERLVKMLVTLARREGEHTAETYKVLIMQGILADNGKTPAENLALVESLLYGTDLPATCISAWVSLSPTQSQVFFHTMAMLYPALNAIFTKRAAAEAVLRVIVNESRARSWFHEPTPPPYGASIHGKR